MKTNPKPVETLSKNNFEISQGFNLEQIITFNLLLDENFIIQLILISMNNRRGLNCLKSHKCKSKTYFRNERLGYVSSF